MKDGLRTSNHAAFSLHYHVILTVKYRHSCVNAAMLDRLREIFSKVCKNWRCTLRECNGEADHVHLLIEGQPSMNLARMVGNLKTVSARYIRQEFKEHLAQYYWKKVFWNSAYGVISVGGHASLETVLRYIQDQNSPPSEAMPGRLTRD